MYQGFDINRKPPYEQKIVYEVDGKKYQTTYYVSRGYGDSLHITSTNTEIINEECADRK